MSLTELAAKEKLATGLTLKKSLWYRGITVFGSNPDQAQFS